MNRGQMKIQEMAFVLVAIMVFFAMVALVYFSIRMGSLKEDVSSQRQESAKELAKKLADIPEFSWAGCSGGCVDMDKVMILKDRRDYAKFWDIDYMMIEQIYPQKPAGECTLANYPECSTIVVINNSQNFGTTSTAYVGLCHYEGDKGGYVSCGIGRINVAGKAIK